MLSLKLKKKWLVLVLISAVCGGLSVPTIAIAAGTRHGKVSAKSKKSKSKLAHGAGHHKGAHKAGAHKVGGHRSKRGHRHGSTRHSARDDDFAGDTSVASASFGDGRSTASAAHLGLGSRASFGQLYGLHHTRDVLELKSSAALVLDQDTNEVVFSKNSDAVLPIASLTKLMTAMVMVESKHSMDDTITVTNEDVDTEKNSSSRLTVGATLTRGQLLLLALMSSENRAAHALGRTYPGGMPAFVGAMNAKARALGMADTHYVDPTGLNSQNQSSAKDLATLVKAAYKQPLIRELSTSQEYAVRVGARQLHFRNTNSLVRNPSWDIGLQKTGYIVEAGRCLVMQTKMAGRKFIMVFLDSAGKYSRQADAERVRHWIEKATQKGAVSGLQPVTKATS